MPLSPADRERIDAYFDGEFSDAEATAFRAWLRADAQNMREFVLYSQLHNTLRSELKGRSVRRTEIQNEVAANAPISSHWNWKKWSAAVAVLLVICSLVYMSGSTDPKLMVFPAKIESVSGPVFVVDQNGADRNPAQANAYLSEKNALEFEGPAHAILKYRDGSTLDFNALVQSTLRLHRGDENQINHAEWGKRISLDNGRLQVDAAPQPVGSPWIISTPQAEVTVIGTVFRLDVTAASTRLDVSHGKVRIARYADSASVDVSADEYVIVTSQGPLLVKPAEKP